VPEGYGTVKVKYVPGGEKPTVDAGKKVFVLGVCFFLWLGYKNSQVGGPSVSRKRERTVLGSRGSTIQIAVVSR